MSVKSAEIEHVVWAVTRDEEGGRVRCFRFGAAGSGAGEGLRPGRSLTL